MKAFFLHQSFIPLKDVAAYYKYPTDLSITNVLNRRLFGFLLDKKWKHKFLMSKSRTLKNDFVICKAPIFDEIIFNRFLYARVGNLVLDKYRLNFLVKYYRKYYWLTVTFIYFFKLLVNFILLNFLSFILMFRIPLYVNT